MKAKIDLDGDGKDDICVDLDTGKLGAIAKAIMTSLTALSAIWAYTAL
jgi:hypothetical protein